MSDIFEKQLCEIINEHESTADSQADSQNLSQLSDLQTRCFAAVERIVGRRSVYFERIGKIEESNWCLEEKLDVQVGVAKALLADIRNGYLESFEETIHGDLFADYLEKAAYLAENGYKDPAAVLAGSTLEVHLRKLCGKHGVATVSGTGKPKKADALNADLEKAGAYNKLDQKNVTAWLDIRNKAAHGKYDEYAEEQVKLFIDSLRNFITRHPA